MSQSIPVENLAPPLHHQFEDLAQQQEAANLGMWCFLVTEVLFFGVLITGYTVYRVLYPNAWEQGSHGLHLLQGSINTAILLTSSLAMALAVKAAKLGQQRQAIVLLVLTAALGCCFLGVKGYEYSLEVGEHKFPLLGFHADPPHPGVSLPIEPGGEQLFYCFYWLMTGVHTTHMIVGVGLMVVMASLVFISGSTAKWATSIQNVGLYWHFVDVVWVFLYPLLYLVGHS